MPNMEKTSLTLEIVKWANEGRGVAHKDGKTYFVEHALPGDVVEASVIKDKKTYAIARTVKRCKASPERRVSPCPHSEQCDGCAMIDLQVQAQVTYKKREVEETLRRIGNYEGEVRFHTTKEWHYRNKATFHLDEKGALSYRQRGTNCPIVLERCPILMESIEHLLIQWNTKLVPTKDWSRLSRSLETVVIRSNENNEIMVVLGWNVPKASPKDRQEVAARVQEYLKMDVFCSQDVFPQKSYAPSKLQWYTKKTSFSSCLKGLSFDISPTSFFQVNRFATEDLYDIALSKFTDITSASILDLYCGTGTTTLLLAQQSKHVLGIESHRAAVENAKVNAERNSVENVEFLWGKAEDHLQRLTKEFSFDRLLVDPPRKGLDSRVISAILGSGIREMVYISCNSSTFARDLRLLQEGGFVCSGVEVVDQFANTHHVEALVLMTRE